MAAQVGGSGSVLGTDLNLDWSDTEMTRHVELRRHDVTSDDIPTSAYDLIHARLVLLHLPQRDKVIDRLVAALAPGGWLVLEEFAQIFPPCPEPTSDEQRIFNRVRAAFSELLDRRGANTTTLSPDAPLADAACGPAADRRRRQTRFRYGRQPRGRGPARQPASDRRASRRGRADHRR